MPARTPASCPPGDGAKAVFSLAGGPIGAQSRTRTRRDEQFPTDVRAAGSDRRVSGSDRLGLVGSGRRVAGSGRRAKGSDR